MQTLTFAYRHADIHITHTFQSKKIYNFRVIYFHNFQICIFPEFPDFWKYGNMKIVETLKFSKYGNEYISHWELPFVVSYIIKVYFIFFLYSTSLLAAKILG